MNNLWEFLYDIFKPLSRNKLYEMKKKLEVSNVSKLVSLKIKILWRCIHFKKILYV